MLTETEIKRKGFEALFDALGDLGVEKFISMLIRDPFDYTKWNHDLFDNKSIEQISKEAMEYQQQIKKK
jgi:peroxiredoxin